MKYDSVIIIFAGKKIAKKEIKKGEAIAAKCYQLNKTKKVIPRGNIKLMLIGEISNSPDV